MIVVGIIFFLCVFIGYKRGLIKIAASLAATILSLVLVTALSPYIGKAILKYTSLEKTVQKKCTEMFLPDAGQEVDLSTIELTREQQITAIEDANIPAVFQKLLLENNNSEVYEALGVTSFVEYIGSYLAKMIANIIAFLLAAFIVIVLVRVLMVVFHVIGKLPVIGGANRIAGGILGLGTAFIIVWIVMIAVSLLYSTNMGQAALADIADSKILTYLYEHNMLMNRLVKF